MVEAIRVLKVKQLSGPELTLNVSPNVSAPPSRTVLDPACL